MINICSYPYSLALDFSNVTHAFPQHAPVQSNACSRNSKAMILSLSAMFVGEKIPATTLGSKASGNNFFSSCAPVPVLSSFEDAERHIESLYSPNEDYLYCTESAAYTHAERNYVSILKLSGASFESALTFGTTVFVN